MGGESCRSCRSWKDDIYWNHFQFVHFAVFLYSGSEQQLALPKRFSDNLKMKLPENVTLKGPGGLIWNMGLTTRDNMSYLTHGWQQFVKDHSLKDNDFLVFKYNGESQFDVLIFEGESFCEKAASYFVRKCGKTEHESGCLGKRNDADTLEGVHTTSNAGVEFASPEKSVPAAAPSETPSNITSNAGVERGSTSTEELVDVDDVTVPAAVPTGTPCEKTSKAGVEFATPKEFIHADGVTVPATVPSQTNGKRISKLISAIKPVPTKQRGRPPKASHAHKEAINWISDSGHASSSRICTYPVLYVSNRRPVTENEKKNALQLAQAACTNDSFSVVMQPTHVYKRFYLTIPSKWATEHLSPSPQEVVLRMGKSEWPAKYYYNQIRCNGGLTGGWKHFSLDNNLEEFDVCVFKPSGKIDNILMLDVNIFRVLDEVAPLSKVNSAGNYARKRGKRRIINAI